MRRTLGSILLLCLALASVGVGALTVVQRNRAELVQQFAQDRQAQLDEATRGVAEGLEDISEDLRFAGELLSQPGSTEEHRRELEALLEVIGQYKAIAASDGGGNEQLRLVDRRAGPLVAQGTFFPQLAETARHALARAPGDVTSSPPLTGGEGAWLRILATATPSEGGQARGAVAVLVDLQSLFAPLRIIASDPEARLLLVGAHGKPSPASDPGLSSWYQRLEVVSYGEEHPAEAGSGESVWSRNRRSEFTVTVAHARAGGW